MLKQMGIIIVVSLIFILYAGKAIAKDSKEDMSDKKIIEWGWHTPALSFVTKKEWVLEDDVVIFDKAES